MKKFLTISAIGVFFIGCMNNSSLSTPTMGNKLRDQNVDPKVSNLVRKKGNDEFLLVVANKRLKTPIECKIAFTSAKNTLNQISDDENSINKLAAQIEKLAPNCVKKDREVELLKLSQLKKVHPELYNLIIQIDEDIRKLFKNKTEYYKQNTPELLNPNNFEVALIKTKSSTPHARYFPYGKIVLMGIDEQKLKTDPTYKAEVSFLIAHELAHAYSLHMDEQITQKHKFDVVTEVALNEAYKRLDKKSQKLLNEVSKVLAKALLTKADYEYDNKKIEERKNSIAAKLAIKAHQQDKLEKMGINMQIPQTTKLVLLELINMNGGNPTDVIKTVLNSLNPSNVKNAIIEEGAYPKNQELEADYIGMKILKELNIDTKKAAKILENLAKKEKNALTSHPSAKERLNSLKQNGLI